ncbi:hypothetical protein D7M11_35905 [Paenibacillus ginsengarvi]|uniref:Uncharacterized protein n=1 Tax=Paenibacillus ginsengarvi TaxID=400777 RepID=A0A3B0AHG2_9BACL|nr:hypothetical protein D7M11_35905 [Paenibacillus ginsengarvi]
MTTSLPVLINYWNVVRSYVGPRTKAAESLSGSLTTFLLRLSRISSPKVYKAVTRTVRVASTPPYSAVITVSPIVSGTIVSVGTFEVPRDVSFVFRISRRLGRHEVDARGRGESCGSTSNTR